MSVKIGHATNGKDKVIGGIAGDATGTEVCMRTWWNKPWSFVLRCKDAKIAEKMAKACEAGCKNNNIGYDQGQRNTAHTEAKKVNYDLSKISTPCETDCSAFMTLCAIAAGITQLEYSGNAPTTSTMRTSFTATGLFDVLTDSKYLTSDSYLKRGDILVKPAGHTVMVLENGSNIASASAYYSKYTGSSVSIVDALKAVGLSDASITVRRKIAAANSISNYAGTAAQNKKMLDLLKQGKLKKV